MGGGRGVYLGGVCERGERSVGGGTGVWEGGEECIWERCVRGGRGVWGEGEVCERGRGVWGEGEVCERGERSVGGGRGVWEGGEECIWEGCVQVCEVINRIVYSVCGHGYMVDVYACRCVGRSVGSGSKGDNPSCTPPSICTNVDNQPHTHTHHTHTHSHTTLTCTSSFLVGSASINMDNE